MCQGNNSTLVTLQTKEEQDSFVEFFKSKQISNEVWIGLEFKKIHNRYEWLNGEEALSTNWAPGSPKQKEYLCVQFDLSDESFSGKWSDVECTKLNLVVCQKTQEWTLDRMKNTLINLVKKATNPIPIGFTYVQLPHEKGPSEFWPEMTWKDVTADYAGVFFRAGGGEASPFGEIQMENTKRISKIDFLWNNDPEWQKVKDQRTPNQNGNISLNTSSSLWIGTGGFGSGNTNYRYMNFESNVGEVRPKNMAIKIWRRIN